MTVIISILAVALMVIGHILKNNRWAQFIDIHERLNRSILLKILSVSHTVNIILPLRIGDICRIYMSSKRMRNGYALAIATVVVDLYLDIVVVSIIFWEWSLFRCGGIELKRVAYQYKLILVVLLLGTMLGVFFKKQLKKFIQMTASIFNEKIELEILFISYTVIASFKDIVHKLNKKKLILYTIGMWCSYLGSYYCFAVSIKKIGVNYNVFDIFTFIFSQNCLTVLLQKNLGDVVRWNSMFIFLLMIYMIIPLSIVWGISELTKRLVRQKSMEIICARTILPHLNGNDKLAFLETYFLNENVEDVGLFLNINQDINIISDLSAGSNATTILCMNDENETFYRKYAFGIDAQKLKEQEVWLLEHQNILPLPIVCGIHEGGGEYFAYDMKYHPDAVGFFNFIHSMPENISWNVLKNVVDILQTKLYVSGNLIVSELDVKEYITDKVQRNLGVISNGGKYIKQLQEYDEIVINGIPYHNLRYYEQSLKYENLIKIFDKDIVSDIHGDLTVENIICKKGGMEGDFYLIDPNTGNRLNTSFIDYAKLLQSLHGGYEFLMLVKNVEIQKNQIRFLYTKSQSYSYLLKKYDELLCMTFSKNQVKSIYFHEIVHWLRLMPYKIRKNEKTAVVFYAGLIMVADDIIKRFEKI